MPRRWISRILVVFAVLLLGVAPAMADIKAFNAAVKAGNYKQAAVEAKSVWATWDRQDRDTAVMAREFGFVSYVAGDFAAARDFAQTIVGDIDLLRNGDQFQAFKNLSDGNRPKLEFLTAR